MRKPHCGSLYCQLEKAGKLDQLMYFLEDPHIPADSKIKGIYPYAAEMVAGWGFSYSCDTIRKLYVTKVLLWRICIARKAVQSLEQLPAYEDEISRLTAQRTFELLTHPALDSRVLVSLARLELQKETLRHNERKFKASLLTKLETALEALSEEIKANPKAREAFTTLHDALKT